MPLSPTDILVKNPKIAARLFDEQMVIITATDSMLHRLNKVGTFIWSLLDKKMAVSEMILAIQEQFEGFDAEKQTAEIITFLEILQNKRLVMVADPAVKRDQ